MRSPKKRTCKHGLGLVALTLLSCGPSYEDREQSREDERQHAIANAQEALAAFAERHRAVPVELFKPGIDPLEQTFTAQLQQQLEGKVVAFRSGVLDIVRIPENKYEIVLGNRFEGGTVVTLSISDQNAAKLLAQPPNRLASVFVVAWIEKVEPLTLTLESCGEPDCTDVRLEPNLLGTFYRISGREIATEIGR